MTKEQKESTNQIKHYQIILFSCFFGCILMLNSNYVNKNRDMIRLDKEREVLFNNLIQQRQLSEDSSSTDEICSRASKDLNEFYKTADLSKIDLEDGPIKAEDKNEGYMKALIKIVRSFADEGGEEEDDEGEGDSDSDSSSSKISKKNILEYGNRLIPMLVFLIIGILSIIGWIVCCFCTCCNCCCCCCCKKPNCKIPCFIFTYVFFALVVAVCIYGLSQANKIFVGLADSECSALKFFDQVLNGETKQTLPRWAGIRSINQILIDLNTTLNSLTGDTYDQLGTHYTTIGNKRSSFNNKMQTTGDEFWDGTNYKTPYVKTYTGGTTDYPRSGNYIYDTVKMFGRWDGTQYTEDSFLDMWNREYSRVSQDAYDNLGRARDSFTDLLDENIGPIQDSLTDGVSSLDELTEPFQNAKEQIADMLAGTSEKIDKYGKMGVKIVFGVLMIINVALAVLLLLICLFSGQACTSCCCCRCIFKICTHVLWNVLALMMILSFIVGALLSLVGRIGGDAMTLVSFIVSEDNFNDEQNPLLLNKLGDAKKYLKRCIQGDGDIAQELNLGDSLDSFDEINNVEQNITNYIDEFDTVIHNLPTYNLIKNRLESQLNYGTAINMIHEDGITTAHPAIVYSEVLDKINTIVGTSNRQWSTEEENNYLCTDTSIPADAKYYPKSCKPIAKVTDGTYTSGSDFDIYANFIDDMDTIVAYANQDEFTPISPNAKSVRGVIDELNDDYIDYLQAYIDALDFFKGVIHRITTIIRRYTGDDNNSAFAFLNGKFIGTNLKIILKYLKHSLGEDFYTVGICLVVVGFSLILSISSTILLIIIINVGLEENKKKEKMSKSNPFVSEFQTNYVTDGPKY